MRTPGFEDQNGQHVTIGDVCDYAFGGTCEVRDVLQDGDAEVVWLSGGPGVPGTHDTIKWNNLTKRADPSQPAAHKPLPVSGYTPQSDEKVALVNSFKQDEERLLRKLDALGSRPVYGDGANPRAVTETSVYDQRWLAVARTHFQEGWMALNRAVFQPQRIKLPEDDGNAPGRQTSPELASLAGRLMDHEDPEVRRLAASALGQVNE